MFAGFFYALRGTGVPVALTEWMTLMEALDKGLANSSLTEFYRLAKSILVKSEAHYDAFDRSFLEYFGGIETAVENIDEALKWVEESLPPLKVLPGDRARWQDWDFNELRGNLAKRMKQQDSEHHGGSYWIGTGGTAPFGHSGYHPAGVRIGGESINRSAVQVASERNFRDFRKDETLNTRHFQTALRSLRQLSRREEGPKEELDLEGTVEATGQNAGHLNLVWDRPRRNNVKLILLMDSGGSMNRYAQLCSRLFKAANNAGHFKECKVYFFHNCIYELLFHEPFCRVQASERTMDVLNTHDHEHKVIIVGDASMAVSELMMKYGALEWNYLNDEPGIMWLRRIVTHFRYVVWLNPIPKKHWPITEGAHTIEIISNFIAMYELTLGGLQEAVKRLAVKK